MHWLFAFVAALILNLGILRSLEPDVAHSPVGEASAALHIAVMALPADAPEVNQTDNASRETAESAASEAQQEAPLPEPEPAPPPEPQPLPVEPVAEPDIQQSLPTKRQPEVVRKVEKKLPKSLPKPKPPVEPDAFQQPRSQTVEPRSRATAATAPSSSQAKKSQEVDIRERTSRPPAEVTGRYTQQLRARIERGKRYPRKALMRGKQGTVTLRLSINASGSLLSVAVVATSGHQVLDEAAVGLAREAAPFAKLPVGEPVPFEVTVPVVYRLR